MMHASQASFRTTHRTSRSLRSAASLGLGLLSLLSLSAGHAYAAPITWNGPTGTDWFATQPGTNTTYWSNGSVPGATDDAQNNTTAAMTLGQSTTINSFFSNGAFTLQGGGTFSGSQANAASTITVNNVFTDNNGAINNFTINQGTGGSLVFTTSGGNSLNGDIVNAGVDMSASSAFVHLFGTNTFNGNINLGAGGSNGIHLDNNTTSFVIGQKGSLTGFGGVAEYNAGSVFNNAGTVNANSAGNTLALTTSNFNNTGTAEATNGGTLQLNNTLTNTGTFSAAGTGSVVSIAGSLTGSGSNLFTASNGGQIQINGASLLGTINTDPNTALVFSTSAANHLVNTTVNGNLDLATNSNAYAYLFGTDTVNGNISLGAGGSNGIHLDNNTTTFVLNGTLIGFGGVAEYNAGSTFTNNGTVNANSSGNTLALTTSNFNNTGTAEATNGATLSLNNTITNTGTLAAHSGGILDISGTLNSNTGNLLDGTGGTLNVMGASLLGTVNLASGSSLVFNTSGANNLSNTTVNGNLDLTSGGTGFVHLYGADTVNGNISLGAGGSNGIHLDNNTSSLVLNGSLVGFGNVAEYNSGSVFTNNGTVNANSAAAPLTINNSNFINTGTAEATNGATLSLNNSITNSAAINAAGAGSVVSVAGTLTSSGNNLITASNGGQVQVNGASLLGTINTDPNTALVFNTSAANNLSNTTVNGNLDLATNSNAFVHLFGADTVNGNISLGAGGSNGIHLDNNSTTFNLGSAGSLTGFGGVAEYNAGSVFNNAGTVNANSAGNTLALTTSNFNNTGTVEATNGGTLALSNSITNNAALNATGAGSVVSLSGTFTGAGNNLITASGGGQVQVNGASLLGTINTDPNTSLVFSTSGANNLSNTTVNGNLDLTSGGTGFVHLYGTDTVNGNISLGASGSNGIHLDNNTTTLNLGSAGSLTGFGDVSEYNAGSVFTNNGTVNASGGTLNINTSNFANTGTTTVQNGATLNVNGGNTDSGNILVKQGGTATFAQGVTQTAGLTQVDGTLNSPLTLTGGTLTGTGTVVGDVANNGGTVSAGNAASPFGTLAVSGAFSQGTAGVFDVGFSSTQNNLLKASGAVTTGGLLDVSYLSAVPYTGSGPFTFLNYGSLTSSITSTGPTQYFSNETFDAMGNGLIAGSNGFTYELLNNTGVDGLQLEVLTNGAPTPAVPEASTTVSLGLLLLLGGGGLVIAKRRREAASPIATSQIAAS